MSQSHAAQAKSLLITEGMQERSPDFIPFTPVKTLNSRWIGAWPVLLSFAICVAFSPAQPPDPAAIYSLPAQNALKSWNGLRLQWALAPDNALILLLCQPNGRATVVRLTGWQTPTPEEQSLVLADPLPDRSRRLEIAFDDPLVDPNGNYLVLRRQATSRNIEAFKNPTKQGNITVVDLHTFKVAYRLASSDLLAGGRLLFNPNGTLSFLWTNYAGEIAYRAAVFSLPNLQLVANCVYGGGYVLHEGPADSLDARIAGDADTCEGFLRAADLVDVQQLERTSDCGSCFISQAGSNDFCFELTRAYGLALYRCGTEHFAGSGASGDPGLTFWKALRVVSLADGKMILSLPLHSNDGSASGIIAQTEGHTYLIVPHELVLRIYLLE